MEIDINNININDILQVLREMITFLECLGDVQLSFTLESLREKLLIRLKNTLSVSAMAREKRKVALPSSEPYMDMKSGPKSLLLKTKSETDSEEYVGMEESQKRSQTHPRIHTHTHQDYYETFETDGSSEIATAYSFANTYCKHDDRDEGSEMLIGIYKNVSAMQIRNKCYKCGPLYKKEGKKLFLSESRACWIALVESHLLIYRSERHNRPYAIYPIRGYKARPAPNMIPRDRRKSESAFEIYSPGNETLQFIARTPKDMDQWIAKICEVGCCDENERNKKKVEARDKPTIVETRTEITEEKSAVVDNLTAKAESTSNKNNIERKETGERAPPLPARIPRRLPSLPSNVPLDNPFTVLSYRAAVEGEGNDDNDDGDDDGDGNDDDDDDIYHRIEDLRNETRYQNLVLSKEKQADTSDNRQEEAVAYDDVRATNEKNIKRNEKMEEGKSHDAVSSQETYDDIVTLSRIDATSIERNNDLSIDASIVGGAVETGEKFYDDVESLFLHGRFIEDRTKDQTEISSKPKKKCFLDRVLSRRESPCKLDKRERHRCKKKISSNPTSSLNTVDMSTYDDVSDLTPSQNYQESLAEEELPEYNHPPPPRPLYQVKLSVESQSPDQTQEFYDDISAYQQRRSKILQQQIMLQSTQNSCTKANEAEHNVMYNIESEMNSDPLSLSAREEIEYYQSPRSDSCIPDDAEMEQNAQLYDDIALLADFTARQRDIVGKRETEDVKSVSSDRKAWNRFGVNKKSRVTSDFNSIESNRRSGNEGGGEIEDSSENNGPIKRNTFKKLISRMENSLAKVSTRSPSSLSTGKSSISSNSS